MPGSRAESEVSQSNDRMSAVIRGRQLPMRRSKQVRCSSWEPSGSVEGGLSVCHMLLAGTGNVGSQSDNS